MWPQRSVPLPTLAGSYGAFAHCWNDMCGKEMIPLGPTVLNFTKSKKAIEEKAT